MFGTYLTSYRRYSNRRPFHLSASSAAAKMTGTDKTMTSHTDSSFAMDTPPSYVRMPPTPTKVHDAAAQNLKDPDSFTISTFSYYAQTDDSMYLPSPSTSGTQHTYDHDYDSEHEHHISVSDAYVSSRSPSPALSVPQSIHPELEAEPELAGAVPSSTPMFHRPFSPPSIYPVNTGPNPGATHAGILVTIHRQASVDDMA